MLSLCIEQYSICQTIRAQTMLMYTLNRGVLKKQVFCQIWRGPLIISFLGSIGPAFWDSLSPFQLKAKQPQIHLNFVLRILLFLITPQAELSIHKTWNERLCTLHFWKLYSDKSLRRTLYYTWNAECRCWLRQRVVQRALLAKQTKGSLEKIHGSKVEAKKLLSRQHALDWLCARAVDAKINFDRLGGQKVAGTKLAWEKRFEGVWMRDWVGGKKVASAKIGPKKVGGIRCLIDLVRKSVQCCGSAQRALNLCTSHELLHFCATLHYAALHFTAQLHCTLCWSTLTIALYIVAFTLYNSNEHWTVLSTHSG